MKGENKAGECQTHVTLTFCLNLLSRTCRKMEPKQTMAVSVSGEDQDWSSAEVAGICRIKYWRGGGIKKELQKYA